MTSGEIAYGHVTMEDTTHVAFCKCGAVHWMKLIAQIDRREVALVCPCGKNILGSHLRETHTVH